MTTTTTVPTPNAAPPSAAHGEHPNQFALAAQRRFAPFFWTQFSGAANDNLFKFAFTVMVTYQLSVSWLPPAMAGLVIGALFILPFLLFSATSGQLTDKYDKTRMIRFVKNLEIAIMALAAWGFVPNVPVLLLCTFLMGLHSTLFGPVKFAYMPQVLNERELTGGNGMVEMGTFVAILLGRWQAACWWPCLGWRTPRNGLWAACWWRWPGGWWRSSFRRHRPPTPACHQLEPLHRDLAQPQAGAWQLVVFRSLLGISWMWFFGAVFLSQFPSSPKRCCTATSKWPRCCWWCFRWASAGLAVVRGSVSAAMSKLAWCRWVPLA
jgi:hypothetical protein